MRQERTEQAVTALAVDCSFARRAADSADGALVGLLTSVVMTAPLLKSRFVHHRLIVSMLLGNTFLQSIEAVLEASSSSAIRLQQKNQSPPKKPKTNSERWVSTLTGS